MPEPWALNRKYVSSTHFWRNVQRHEGIFRSKTKGNRCLQVTEISQNLSPYGAALNPVRRWRACQDTEVDAHCVHLSPASSNVSEQKSRQESARVGKSRQEWSRVGKSRQEWARVGKSEEDIADLLVCLFVFCLFAYLLICLRAYLLVCLFA